MGDGRHSFIRCAGFDSPAAVRVVVQMIDDFDFGIDEPAGRSKPDLPAFPMAFAERQKREKSARRQARITFVIKLVLFVGVVLVPLLAWWCK